MDIKILIQRAPYRIVVSLLHFSETEIETFNNKEMQFMVDK